jgi:hypothetical protein
MHYLLSVHRAIECEREPATVPEHILHIHCHVRPFFNTDCALLQLQKKQTVAVLLENMLVAYCVCTLARAEQVAASSSVRTV